MNHNDVTRELHRHVQSMWAELDTVIGWGAGYDPLHAAPLFVRDAEDVGKLLWSPFCVQNLTGFLVKEPAAGPRDKSKRIGICVRGCDSRSLVALMQEKFISREALHIIGIPCRGTIDLRRLEGVVAGARAAALEGEELVVEDAAGGVHRLPLEVALERRCLRCRHPNPLIFDALIGEPVEPRATPKEAYRQVDAMDALPLKERLSFWQGELERCIRCYACRNACPLCVCQDRCIAETREPGWVTQRMDLPEKFLFHFIHAMHLAGRCTECGECERVCPMGIPVTLIKEKLGRSARDLLGYEAGMDPSSVPPLLTYDAEASGI